MIIIRFFFLGFNVIIRIFFVIGLHGILVVMNNLSDMVVLLPFITMLLVEVKILVKVHHLSCIA